MVFHDGIDSLYEELLKFLKEYESLNDSAPFDLNIFKLLKQDFEFFKDHALVISNNCEIGLDKNDDDFDSVMKKYNSDSISLNKSYYNVKKAIDEEMKTNIEKLEEEIEREKIDNQNHNTGKEMEIEWSQLSNEQSSHLIKEEHKNAISRYDYQREHYRNVYNESVKDFNIEAKEKINAENEKYEQEMQEFEINSSAIINRYEDNISAESDILAKYTSEFSAKQAKQREAAYKETVELNDRIRNLVTNNNRKLIEEKTDYIKDQNINKLEKDLNRQTFLSNSQSVSRTFVSKMTTLDEKIDIVRNEYNNNIANETKNIQFKLLKIHKDEEREIALAISTTSNKKEQNSLIKKISKRYYNLANEERKKSNKIIKSLKISFSLESENDAYNKKVLDLNRSYDLKIVTEKEQRDNKYYQELNNMDENDYSFKTKRQNIEYKSAANLVRLENSIKELETKAEYDKINAGHQKEIQALLTKVKKIRYELDAYKKFENKILELDRLKHERTIQFLTVNAVLDIEKCKVLMEYNERKYNHNVNNVKNTLGAGDIKLKNQNNRVADTIRAELRIDNEISRAKIEKLEHQIKIFKQKHDDALIRAERDNKYDSKNLISDALFNRFKLEIKSFGYIANAYALIIKELEHLCTSVFDDVLDNIKLRPEYMQIVRNFFQKFINKISDYYKVLVNDFIILEKRIIEDRIQFEKEFKFKSDFDSLMIEFNSNVSLRQDEKTKTMDEIGKVFNEIEGRRQAIFAIRNQIAYIKNPYGITKEKNPKAKLISLVKERKAEEANIEKLEKKLVPLKSKLEKIEIELNEIQSENEKKENQINNLQRDGAESYYTLKRNLDDLFDNLGANFAQRILKSEENADCQNYQAIMQARRVDLINFDTEIIRKLYDAINKFRTSTISTIEKADSILRNEYSKDCIKLDSKAENNVLLIEQLIERDENDSLEYIKVLESEKRAIIRRHDRIEKEFNDFILETSNISSKEAIEIDETFYSEYYAISSNQRDITLEYQNDIKTADRNADLARIEYIKNVAEGKAILDEELRKYIYTRNEYIKDIPFRKRVEKEALNKEVKEKNKALFQEKMLNRANYIKERAEHYAKIKDINSSMDLRIKNIELERKRKLRKEKRAHSIRIKRLSFTIKI